MKATSPRDFSAKNPRTSGNSRAFSLVFSLIIMSLMLMLVLCLVALLTVEMRLSANAVDQQRARFNALASAKLALAHLQQEAGPDQRITAQANTTIAFTSVNGPTRTEVRQKWKSKNPYWTGVWDPREAYTYAPEENNTPATNGNPSKDRPPAWLVSGDAQLQTLSGERQYPSDYKTPWEVVKTDDKDTVTLFNSLPSDEDSDNSDTHPFDTKVTVSRVNFLSPDNNTIGRYAYWIADEGVKARLNMIDRFSKEQAKTTPAVSRFYAPVRAAFETFPLWDKLRFDDKTPANVFDVPGFANLFESPTQLVTNPLSNAVATYAHAVTAVSQGIMTDARHGGLKQDLSVLFELEERDFNDTPFGARGPGDNIEQLKALKGATLLFDADSSTESTASGAGVKNPRWDAFKMGIMEGGGRVKSGRPLFNVKGVLGTGGEDKDGNLLGPPWAIMRDQYRLYKEEDTVRYGGRDRPASVADDGLFRRRNYENGTFLARTWEPNATPNYQMIKTWPHTTPIFSHVVTNDEMAGKDPHTTDLYTKTGLKGVPRPMTVAATPQAVRYVLTFGLIRHGDALRFVVNPVAVVHNPYDVPMKYLEGAVPQGLGGDRAGMRLSLRYQTVTVRIALKGEGGKVIDQMQSGLLDLFKKQEAWNNSGRVDDRDIFSVFVPASKLEPGEIRIYSGGADGPVPWNRYLVCKPGFNFRGGYYLDNLKGSGDAVKTPFVLTEEVTEIEVEVKDAGDSYVRELVRNNETEDIGAIMTSEIEFCNVAEHQEFFRRNYDTSRNGQIGVQTVRVSLLPQSEAQPYYFGLLEWFEKYTDWEGVSGDNNLPTYALTNPLAATRRRDGYGYGRSGRQDASGYWTSGISWQYRMVPLKTGTMEGYIHSDGYYGYGGNSFTSAGQTHVIHASLPRAPMLSIGQYQHANIHIYDNMPFHAVGNSFPSPWVPASGLYEPGSPGNWTHFDLSWLLNAALWDHFFFSSIAPEVDASDLKVAPRILRDQKKVWEDFTAISAESYKPLPNVSFFLNPSADPESLKALLTDKKTGFAKSAAYLFHSGLFNINATDERAWKTILAGTRALPIPASQGGEAKDESKTPLPRTVPIRTPAFALASDAVDAKALWQGAKALSDTQLQNFVANILKKIRLRWGRASGQHSVNYVSPAGDKLCRPFFSLAEFINRPVKGQDAQVDKNMFGIIQNALFQSDEDGGDKAINASAGGRKVKQAALSSSFLGKFPYPNSIPDNTIPVALGAPGMIMQADVLQAIGEKLTVRSDTFIIRAYGDTIAEGGGGRVAGSAILEMVVQRSPEYVDDSTKTGDAPHVRPARLQSSINKYLGRKFRIVSLRWLAPSEL